MRMIKLNMEIESVDIPTMNEMSDAEYRDLVSKHGLVTVDHHDVLRSAVADYPLATNLEQFDIFIEELQALREKMVSRE